MSISETIPEIDALSSENLLKTEKMMAIESPDYLIERNLLEIKTKDAELIPFKKNKIQRLIDSKIREIQKAGRPVRLWLLKFRQGGCSTFIEGKIFVNTSQRENINSLIMADQKEKSVNIFEMSKLFQERLEVSRPHLLYPLKKSNEKKLEWDKIHSQIIITSGENVDAARSFSFQYVHLSECAFFRDLGGVLKALLQSVPAHKNTIVIGETTANGIGGAFFDEWQRAKKGNSDWVAMFLGWYLMEEYTRPLALDNDALYPILDVTFDTDGGRNDFLQEENQLRTNYKVPEDQLNWRRWCIVNNCRGEVSTFRQEYPADDDEAFLVSGKCIFDKIRLKQQKMDCRAPIAKGNFVELDGKAVFRDNELGHIKIYQWPDKDMQIAIGGDGARTLTGDPTAAVAINKKNLKTILTLHTHIDPDQFAVQLRLLGMFCNLGIVAAENNDSGHTTNEKLFKIYGNTYVKTKNDGKDIQEIGWKTTTSSRPQMIAQLKQEIRENATDLMDEELIDECLNFIENEDGKLAAGPGCHDDLVIARMIAGQLVQKFPYVPVKSDWKDGYKPQPQGRGAWAA